MTGMIDYKSLFGSLLSWERGLKLSCLVIGYGGLSLLSWERGLK